MPWSFQRSLTIGGVTFACQVKYTPPGGQGDSGGPVFRYISDTNIVALGIHFATNVNAPAHGYYSPLGNIESEFWNSTILVCSNPGC